MTMKDIMDLFRAGILTVEEANEKLEPKGYILKDPFETGVYNLFPLESRL